MNPAPASPSEAEPAVDKPITETVSQPVAPVDSTPSAAIEQKEDVPSEGAAKPVEPIEVEKKAEANGVASPLASPALDASASPSKAERHVPYAPPHRRRNANDDSRDEASGGEGAAVMEEATAAEKPVKGQGEEGPPRKTKDKQFKKKDKGAGFQKDKPRVEGEKGGKEEEAAPMPKRERKVRPANRGEADAAPASTPAAPTQASTAPTAAMPKRESTQDARQEGGRFVKEGRPERPEKKGWTKVSTEPSGTGGQGSGAGWKKRGEGEGGEGSGARGGKRRDDDDVLIVFDVSMGEHQSHRVEYRKGQDFTEVIRSFCQQNNLSHDYAPRLEAYLRARAPPGVFPPKPRASPAVLKPGTGGPSRTNTHNTEPPQPPATQQAAQPSQAQAPFGRQDVRYTKSQPTAKAFRDAGAKENQAQFGNGHASMNKPPQEGEGGKPMARGRSKERGVNKQGEGEGQPKRAGSKVRQNSRGPPVAKPPTSVQEFLQSIEASAGLRSHFEREGFVHMDSLLELARDKRDFKEQMMAWGLKSGQAYDLLAKIRPFLGRA